MRLLICAGVSFFDGTFAALKSALLFAASHRVFHSQLENCCKRPRQIFPRWWRAREPPFPVSNKMTLSSIEVLRTSNRSGIFATVELVVVTELVEGVLMAMGLLVYHRRFDIRVDS